ncbi:hypothetical protein [Rhizobium mongolense]|uniref:hypothetical protein n=1 Tax=Rhizobium mongolense TaxID=57676 RepID=UPI0034A0D96F
MIFETFQVYFHPVVEWLPAREPPHFEHLRNSESLNAVEAGGCDANCAITISALGATIGADRERPELRTRQTLCAKPTTCWVGIIGHALDCELGRVSTAPNVVYDRRWKDLLAIPFAFSADQLAKTRQVPQTGAQIPAGNGIPQLTGFWIHGGELTANAFIES